MKRIIVTEAQLREYVETKKSEKIFYDIVEDLHKNAKYLTENISREKADKTVIENYRRKNLLTTKVLEMLVKYKVIDEKQELVL